MNGVVFVDIKPKGFVKKQVSVTSGEAKITPPTYLDYRTERLIRLDVKDFYDRSEIIRIFGSIDVFYEWRKQAVEIWNKRVRKNWERKETEGEEAYKIPTFKRNDEVSPSYFVGEDGFARQRKE
jgi:hypothetical protein